MIYQICRGFVHCKLHSLLKKNARLYISSVFQLGCTQGHAKIDQRATPAVNDKWGHKSHKNIIKPTAINNAAAPKFGPQKNEEKKTVKPPAVFGWLDQKPEEREEEGEEERQKNPFFFFVSSSSSPTRTIFLPARCGEHVPVGLLLLGVFARRRGQRGQGQLHGGRRRPGQEQPAGGQVGGGPAPRQGQRSPARPCQATAKW